MQATNKKGKGGGEQTLEDSLLYEGSRRKEGGCGWWGKGVESSSWGRLTVSNIKIQIQATKHVQHFAAVAVWAASDTHTHTYVLNSFIINMHGYTARQSMEGQ